MATSVLANLQELIDLSSDFSPTPLNLLKLNFAYQEVIEQQIAMIDRLLKENHCKKVSKHWKSTNVVPDNLQ